MNLPVRPPCLQAIESRRRLERNDTLGLGGASDRRKYFCSNCGEEKVAARVPPGWYSLRRHFSNEIGEKDSHRLGLFCCAACLLEQMPRLMRAEDDFGKDWVERTALWRA